MKKLLLALLTVASLSVSAQNVDLRRKIEVSGVADAEVTPDIIYFGISLKEYKDGDNKVSIDVLEKQLVKAVADAGIPKEDFTINNASSYSYYYQLKKDPSFLAGKQYRLKLHNLNAVTQILSSLDAKGIQNTGVESSEYSKAPELKRELKIKALLAAKEKATYLLSSVGEKVGSIIDVNEMDNTSYNYYNPTSNTSLGLLSRGDSQQSDIGYRSIKLSFKVNAVFEIAN